MWLRNVLIVWLLTGMWHGASWNFIVWGLYYALLLLLEKKLLMPALGKLKEPLCGIISYIYTIFVTLVGWTIFYYTEGDFISRLGTLFGINSPAGDIYELTILKSNIWLLIASLILCTPLISSLLKKLFDRIGEERRYTVLRASKTIFVIGTVFLCTVMLAGNTYNPFLYFRF